MKKRHWKVKLLGLVLIVLGTWGACHLLTGSDLSEDELIFDRLWVTDFPDEETEFAYDFFMTSGGDYGSFARYSMFRYEEEIFEYQRDGQTVSIHFPQTGRRTSVDYRIRSCDDLPPYNLCLDFDENPWYGPRRYYGIRGDDEPEPETGRLQRRSRRAQRR